MCPVVLGLLSGDEATTAMRASTVTILVVDAIVALLGGRRQSIANRRDLGLLAAIGVLGASANLVYAATAMGAL